MTSGSYVFITTSFEALHRWPAAPNAVKFLRNPHRHIFHVKAWMRVNHDDRDVEFILLKREVDAFIEKELQAHYDSTRSCEQWGKVLIEQFDFIQVEISEDGENGALIIA